MPVLFQLVEESQSGKKEGKEKERGQGGKVEGTEGRQSREDEGWERVEKKGG